MTDQKKEEPSLFVGWSPNYLLHYIEVLKEKLSRSEAEKNAALDRIYQAAKEKIESESRGEGNGFWVAEFIYWSDLQTIIDSEKAR